MLSRIDTDNANSIGLRNHLAESWIIFFLENLPSSLFQIYLNYKRGIVKYRWLSFGYGNFINRS